jgi:hypothetical protein
VRRDLRERHRHLIRQMQAEVDGHGHVKAPRKAKPAFIESAHLRPWWAEFDVGGDPLIWFAIWNRDRNVATAVDASPGDLEPCEQCATGLGR